MKKHKNVRGIYIKAENGADAITIQIGEQYGCHNNWRKLHKIPMSRRNSSSIIIIKEPLKRHMVDLFCFKGEKQSEPEFNGRAKNENK